LENPDQKVEVLIHLGTENSWIINHLIVTEMIKGILGVMVAGKKDIWLKVQT